MKTTRIKTSKTTQKTHVTPVKNTPATKSVLGRGLADLLPSAAGPAQALFVALAPVIDDADVAYELDAGDVSVLPDVPGDAPLILSDADVIFIPPAPSRGRPVLGIHRLAASHARHAARLARFTGVA